MNDLEARIRDVLREDANRVPFVGGMPEQVRPRVRRRQATTVLTTSLAAVALIAGSVFVVRSLDRSGPTPIAPPASLDLTATIGGAVEVSSPRDWYLVDHWPATDSEIHPPTEDPLVMLEVANFDPGLSDAICPAEPGGSRPLPADGVAVSVTLGTASDPAERCAGAIVDVRTGTASGLGIPYTSVVVAGPDASDRDRATAAEILDRVAPTGGFAYYRTGKGSPGYVLEAWSDGTTTSTFEARPSNGNVELTVYQIGGQDITGGESLEVSGSEPVEAPDGGVASFGAVTDDVVRVELHHSGIDEPFVATRVDLPLSLGVTFDAFVFVPQPEGGPYEVIGYGADGEVLYSSIPPLTDTLRVGTVRAFGTTWAVKLSAAADGYWRASCVEPAATSTLDPCERGWGGGSLVQSFDTPVPAVFVTQYQGVESIDVVTDDGRRYPAVMVPTGGGASVAVVALEGAGQGRFVYQMSDGRVDQGRRPEARVDWPDVGQVIGDVGIAGS